MLGGLPLFGKGEHKTVNLRKKKGVPGLLQRSGQDCRACHRSRQVLLHGSQWENLRDGPTCYAWGSGLFDALTHFDSSILRNAKTQRRATVGQEKKGKTPRPFAAFSS